MKEAFEPEKWIWSESDFEVMGWHDSDIHGIAFYPDTYEIAFDIDYIFVKKFLSPQGTYEYRLTPEGYYDCWISPATLVFWNVSDVEFDLRSYNSALEIDSIERTCEKEKPLNANWIGRDTQWTWILKCQEGEIRFKSVGYFQYIREIPKPAEMYVGIRARGDQLFFRGRVRC